jgi:DNA invertase Pin-like site-specific DNA recombinase
VSRVDRVTGETTYDVSQMDAAQIWRSTVAMAASKARTALPESSSRIDKAAELVLNDQVELLDNGQAMVKSQSTQGITSYTIANGTCECADYVRAPASLCKHRLARGIFIRAMELAKEFTAAPGTILSDLRDLVQTHGIQAVIVCKLDRFARDLGGQIYVVQEFETAGGQVYDTTYPPSHPSPERKLMQHIQGAIAEYEHAQIRERTARGRRGRAQAGVPFQRSPLGYRYVPTEKKKGHYEIDPEEAALVLQIFQWYVTDGLTIEQIAIRLNRQQVRTPQMRRGIQRTTRALPLLV